jgi:diguanylate cyclase (GGDEF)-like protein
MVSASSRNWVLYFLIQSLMVDIQELTRPPLVLIASGEEWSARSLESVLSPRGYAVVKAYNGQQMTARVRNERPDVLIIEDTLPDVPAVTACQNLRADPDVGVGTPILLTAPSKWGGKDRLAALSAGAWDVFALPTDAEELFLRLHTYALAKLQVEQAKQQSLTDLETGFYNLWGLVRRLTEVASSAKRFSRPVSCVLLETTFEALAGQYDIDPAGHPIRNVAAAVRSTIRMHDIAGRISRTTFAILAPDTDEVGCRALASRLDTAISAAPAAGAQVQVRLGCYASENFADAGLESAEIMARAASALQRAQSTESPAAVFYDELPHSVA